MSSKRKKIDKFLQIITYFAASIAVIILSFILFFIFKNGSGLINFDLITNDYHAQYYNGGIEEVVNFSSTTKPQFLTDDDYYSEKWGLALTDQQDREGNKIIVVSYVAQDSPLNLMYDKNNPTNNQFKIEKEQVVTSIKFYDKASALSSQGALNMINQLNEVNEFREIVFSTLGGGIRGSLITTLYVIGLTLIFALPIGIFTAIYLNEFAKKNKITNFVRSMIEMLTGVPSIIYGLMGLAVFVPLTVKYTPANSANILSGSLTLAVILLPIIIRSTEESLKVVPDDFRLASLALGANNAQTTFKVVIPSAIPGILTAVILAIGRIIGESAALIFAIGTTVKDEISIFGKSTTLAVHIWSLMTDEPANIELASTIALIILIIVLILNVLVKLLSRLYLKKGLA
ncbi:MAG: phosphate ABC transporter permease PstA [Candidatus Izemoplasmatales bacterium]